MGLRFWLEKGPRPPSEWEAGALGYGQATTSFTPLAEK